MPSGLLCCAPHGIFIPGRMYRYQEVSEQVLASSRSSHQ